MDQLDLVLQQTALGFKPDGISGVARRIGKNVQVLINKLNPNNDQHVVTLRETIAIMDLTQDFRALEVMAEQAGFDLVPRQQGSRPDIMHALLATVANHGDVSHAIDAALSDNTITSRELLQINNRISAARCSLNELEAAVAARAEQDSANVRKIGG